MTAILGFVRKDLLLFFRDRRAVILSFAVPIAIASFFGSIFSGGAGNREPSRLAVLVVDQDDSAISRGIVAGARADANLAVEGATDADARARVRSGASPVAIVIPPGFGAAAGPALFGQGQKPALEVLFDPSRSMEVAMVRGLMAQFVMQAVTQEMFGGAQGRAYIDSVLPQLESSTVGTADRQALGNLLRSVRAYYDSAPSPNGGSSTGSPEGGASSPTASPVGFTMPYTIDAQAMTARPNAEYNGYAHSFGGMAMQFLLFAMANLGIDMLVERQRGLWLRLRSAPVSRLTVLGSKAISGTIISFLILAVSFTFAIIVFKVRIEGSVIGLLAVGLACSLMAATFGLLVAGLGGTPATARGVTTMAVLLMVMLGGAWVPTFVFPAWLQRLTVIVPARWAVDGFDAMTWRGIGLLGAVLPTTVLLAFAALFATVAVARFRWTER